MTEKLFELERNEGYRDEIHVSYEDAEATAPPDWEKVVVLKDGDEISIVAKLQDGSTDVLTGRAA